MHLDHTLTAPRFGASIPGIPRLSRRAGFWAIAFSFIAVTALSTAPSALYGLYARQDHLAPLTLTVVYAVYVAGVTVSLLLAGHVSDWYGRRAVLIPALIVAAAAAALFIAWHSLTGLLVARVLTGLALGATVATATAYVTDLDPGADGRPTRRSEVVGTIANVGGLAAGPLVAGLLARYAPHALTIPFAVLLAALVVAVLLVALAPEGHPAAHPLPRYRPQRLAVPAEARGQFLASIAGIGLSFATWGLFAGLAGRFLSGPLHHPSPALTGAAIFVNFGVGVVVQITTAAWPARRRFVVGIPTILVGLVVLVASAWTSPPSLALFLTAGLLTGIGASAIFRSSLGVVVSRANPDDRAGALATFFTVGYAALSLPVLGLGVALEYLSPQVTLLVFALIVGAGILAAAPTLLRRPDAGRRQDPRARVPGLPHQGVPRARRDPHDVSVDPAPSQTTGSERDMTTTEQIATVTHLRPVPARPLAARLATAPGLVRAGAASWDGGRTPIHPLSLESAYADADLLRDLGARGARFARELGVDAVVGAETAGVPLAAAVSLAGGQPFAFVRKPGYRGHEIDEPPVRGADVAGRRVLLVDDAISSGASVERFTAALASVGAEVVGVFVLVDMRDVTDTVSPVAAALPTESVSSYLEVLDLAAADGILDPEVHDLTVDAALHHWADDDPRWELLPVAA